MSDVTPEEVSWLWPGRFPLGKLSLLVGDPGLGKSFLTLDIAARLSRGEPWPDHPDEAVTPGNTVLLSAEDDPGDTIRPRLDTAEADTSRIHVVTGVQRSASGEPKYFSLDADLGPLEDAIAETKARLVVIDPISAYLGGRDSHSNADIRGLLAPLADLAARHKCAVVAVTHLNKAGGGQAMYRAMGSLAFIAAARIGWLVGKDPEDDTRRLLLPIKSNLIAEPNGIAFQVLDGRVRWFAEPIDVDADTVLRVPDGDRAGKNAAADWLKSQLVCGPLPVVEIRAAAEANGHSWRTVERAKASAGVVATKEGYAPGRWMWSIPGARNTANESAGQDWRSSNGAIENGDSTRRPPERGLAGFTGSRAKSDGEAGRTAALENKPALAATSPRIPLGWTARTWPVELERKATACADGHPETAADYRRQAAAIRADRGAAP